MAFRIKHLDTPILSFTGRYLSFTGLFCHLPGVIHRLCQDIFLTEILISARLLAWQINPEDDRNGPKVGTLRRRG